MIGHGGLLSVFLHSPDEGFWAGLEDSPPDGQILGFYNTKHSSGRIVPRVTIAENYTQTRGGCSYSWIIAVD